MIGGARRQRRVDGIKAREQSDDEGRLNRGPGLPGQHRRIACRVAWQRRHQPGCGIPQAGTPSWPRRRSEPGQQVGTGSGRNGRRPGHDAVHEFEPAVRR